MDTLINRWMDGEQMDEWKVFNGWMSDRWSMDGWMRDQWMDEWKVNGWMSDVLWMDGWEMFNVCVCVCVTLPRSSLAKASRLEEVDMVLSSRERPSPRALAEACFTLAFFSDSWTTVSQRERSEPNDNAHNTVSPGLSPTSFPAPELKRKSIFPGVPLTRKKGRNNGLIPPSSYRLPVLTGGISGI